jgi:hypothetical protein
VFDELMMPFFTSDIYIYIYLFLKKLSVDLSAVSGGLFAPH